MDPYTNTVFQDVSVNGSDAAKAAPFKRKYVAVVYQGDTAFLTPFRDTVAFATGVNLPTGSIAYVNDGNATPGTGAAGATNCPVPYLVYVGNDQKTVISQQGNAAGGTVSLIPCTGYFRVTTTVFDTEATFAAGDFLKAKVDTFDGLTSVGIVTNGANIYSDVVIGIADGAAGVDHFDLPTLRFTCYFIPPMVAASN